MIEITSFQVLAYFVGLGAVVIGLVAFYRLVKRDKDFQALAAQAETSVHYAEQMFGLDNATKFNYAMVGLKEFAKVLKIEVPDEQLRAFLEAAVHIMKVEMGTAPTGATAQLLSSGDSVPYEEIGS